MKNIINKKKLLIWGLLIVLPYMGLMAKFNFVPTQYHSYSFQPQNLGIASPQTSDFQRYGNIPVNHYNGLLDLEIALDGYKDKDFDLPISLKYISNGFIPSKRPSMVGMNWVLNFGGVITRAVKGTPDDTRGNYTTDERKYLKDGLLVAMRDGNYVNYTDDQLTSFNISKNSKYYKSIGGDFKHDFEPDIFYFNFGSHQGKFLIGKDGKPVCLIGEAYKIDISGLSIQNNSSTAPPVASTIKIITPEGYIYEFGGNVNYLEYNIPNNPEKTIVKPRHIISWYLKSIKSPSNREVSFIYNSRLLPNHYNYYVYARQKVDGASTSGPFDGDKDEAAKIEIRDKVYSPVISEVIIDNKKIKIETTPGVAFFDVNDPTYYITRIALYYNSACIKESTFEYETKGKYNFLKKLRKNDEVYKFDYYSFTPPSPLTTSVDHWGYWNGGYETDVTDIRSFCKSLDSYRATKNLNADVGLLKTITYPTGGSSTIYYEKNTYSRYLKRNLADMTHIVVLNEKDEVYCGGSRVKRIIDGEMNNIRDYEYKSPSDSAKSSGIVSTKQKYSYNETFVQYLVGGNSAILTSCYVLDISSNSLGAKNNISDYHIGYSDVVEKLSSGYNHYQYISMKDIPDAVDGFTGKASMKYVLIGFELEVLEKCGIDIISDLSHFRGKLKKKITYDVYKSPKMIEEYTYNSTSAKETYIVAVASSERGYSSYRIYKTPCLLMSKKITDENGVVTTESYDYNSYNFISKQQVTNSDGTNYSTKYDYLFATWASPEADYYMHTNNILNKPFNITKMVKDSVIDATKCEYKMAHGFPVLSKIKKLEMLAPAEQMFDRSLMTDTKIYHNYDKYGNPLYVTREDGTQVVYIWSYEGQYPIAKIEFLNDNYAHVESVVKSVFSVSDINSLAETVYPNATKLIEGYLQDVLPMCHVTTYTYNPLVGISTITDPAGKITYYLYDNGKRLKEIYRMRNGQKEVIEFYEYNYINK